MASGEFDSMKARESLTNNRVYGRERLLENNSRCRLKRVELSASKQQRITTVLGG